MPRPVNPPPAVSDSLGNRCPASLSRTFQPSNQATVAVADCYSYREDPEKSPARYAAGLGTGNASCPSIPQEATSNLAPDHDRIASPLATSFRTRALTNKHKIVRRPTCMGTATRVILELSAAVQGAHLGGNPPKQGLLHPNIRASRRAPDLSIGGSCSTEAGCPRAPRQPVAHLRLNLLGIVSNRTSRCRFSRIRSGSGTARIDPVLIQGGQSYAMGVIGCEHKGSSEQHSSQNCASQTVPK